MGACPKRWAVMQSSAVSSRVEPFCRRFDVSVPILLAPMAGACPRTMGGLSETMGRHAEFRCIFPRRAVLPAL
ncbi:hypothetical protein C7E25_18155 [Stenotrophomonas maltophilia]|nr:hypothetical protein C7E25_18155 [Stenotrophomonas maltophilia]